MTGSRTRSTPKRYVWGARAERALLSGDRLVIRLNYAAARDDKDFFSSSDTYKLGNVVSSDVRYGLSQAGKVAPEQNAARQTKTANWTRG